MTRRRGRLTVVGGSATRRQGRGGVAGEYAFIAEEVTPPARNAIVKGLKESGHAEHVLKAAIKLGITRGRIVTKLGKRNAQLHSRHRGDGDAGGSSDRPPAGDR